MADAQLRLEDDVKTAGLRGPLDIQQLVSEHQQLDERIRHLSTKTYLTDAQQFEEIELKKRKLALKDRIESLRQNIEPIPAVAIVFRRAGGDRLADPPARLMPDTASS